MAEKEQVKPLAPSAAYQSFSHNTTDDEALSTELKRRNCPRKFINYCGCFTAIILILAVTILILMFTVFRVKDPSIKMESVRIDGLDSISRTNPNPATNLTVTADVSIKNPNVASFRFNDVTTDLYYDGTVVGQAWTPPGLAPAQRTIRVNVTLDVMVDKVLRVPRLVTDVSDGALAMNSYTRIEGRVKIVNIIKKEVLVRMNCSFVVSLINQAVQGQECHNRISL